MTVSVTGSSLTLEQLVQVSRGGAGVAIDPGVHARMETARRVLERMVKQDEAVYGVTTGVAALKRVRVPAAEIAQFNAGLIRSHRIAQGPAAPGDVVRAMMLRLLNQLASGYPGVRTQLLTPLVEALNSDRVPTVRSLGSTGVSDLGPNADLAAALYGDMELAAGEALALLNHGAYSTGAAALAVADAGSLADALTLTGALSLEAFGANLSVIDSTVPESRPYPGLTKTVVELRRLLEGSYLWEAGAARNLQDPLTFRSLPQTLGAFVDALGYAREVLAIELNASQGNPIVAIAEDRVISVGNFDIVPLAAALDLVRIALAPVLTSCGERTLKLLEKPWSGLPPGLNPSGGADLGLGELGVALQSMVAEARLIAQPVSFEMASSTHAEGIEDRMTMAPLSARRLAEMVALGQRCAGIELLVSGQAVEARATTRLGQGTGAAVKALRSRVPFVSRPEQFPSDLEPVNDLIRSGGLSRPVFSAQPAGPGSGTAAGRSTRRQ
jgi:histidine ammonia-lyase